MWPVSSPTKEESAKPNEATPLSATAKGGPSSSLDAEKYGGHTSLIGAAAILSTFCTTSSNVMYPRAYGVPVDASLKDKVPTKCRGYGRDAAAAAAAKLANLADVADVGDGTSAARNARPSFLFGAFAPPRAARDALAGEAAFFARHDAFGVVHAGSCWARFDEFEGSSSDASKKKGRGVRLVPPRRFRDRSERRRCFFARVAAARAARLARTLRDARSSDDSEARGSRCTLRRLARAARSIAAGARERARERNERRGSDRRLFASGGSRSGSSRAERDRRLHRLGRSSGLRAARRVSSRLRAGFAVEPPRPHILRARASPGRAGGSPGRSRRRLRRGGRRR